MGCKHERAASALFTSAFAVCKSQSSMDSRKDNHQHREPFLRETNNSMCTRVDLILWCLLWLRTTVPVRGQTSGRQ